MRRYALLIPAAGSGRRFGSTKQWEPIAGKALILHTLQPFLACDWITDIRIAIRPEDKDRAMHLFSAYSKVRLVVGGATRQASVYAALQSLPAYDDQDWALVHDAARPCVRVADVEKLRTALMEHPTGGILACPLADTLKYSRDGAQVDRTPPREGLWLAQTPQMFRIGLLKQALALGDYTDEASAVEALGETVALIEGASDNFKVTTPADFSRATTILNKTGAAMRIGHGYDIHRMGPGNQVTLGGVAISHHQGVVAHSDGDVLIHALCDALLGAAGLGDIGHHFPDTDPQYRNQDSTFFLKSVMQLLRNQGWKLANADISIIAEAPKIAPHIRAMRTILSAHLGVPPGCVNVKATTAEGLGALGREEGIAVHAVVLIEQAF